MPNQWYIYLLPTHCFPVSNTTTLVPPDSPHDRRRVHLLCPSSMGHDSHLVFDSPAVPKRRRQPGSRRVRSNLPGSPSLHPLFVALPFPVAYLVHWTIIFCGLRGKLHCVSFVVVFLEKKALFVNSGMLQASG